MKIVLISCVSKKLDYSAKVKDLYISTLFKFNLKYAVQLQPDAIYILSAEYGLIGLNQVVDPYDKTLNKMKINEVKLWSEYVLKQLKHICDLDKTEFVFLAGEKYRKFLIPYLFNVEIPLKGLRIGEQLQALKRLIK